MTNKEGITYLEWLSNVDFSKKYPTYPMVTNKTQVEALKMAITALDQLNNNSTKHDNSNLTQSNGIESKAKGLTACRVPEDDCISRQSAIDIFDDYNVSVENGELEAYSRDRKRLCDLPSVQPIIRCRDCIAYQEGIDINGKPFTRCNGSVRTYGHTLPDWYCADAERRTDERTD